MLEKVSNEEITHIPVEYIGNLPGETSVDVRRQKKALGAAASFLADDTEKVS